MIIQYLAIALLIALVGYAFIDFKKAVLIWLPLKLLFNDQIAVRYEAPGMSLVIAGDLMLIAVFMLKGRFTKLYNAPFLFKKPAILLAFSYAVSTVFTIAPLQSAFIATVKYFASGFCMLYLAQKCITSLSDVKYIVKCYTIVAFLIMLLAFSENILRTNLWLDFVYFNSPFDITSGRMFYISGHQQLRYGIVQSFSFFSFHVLFGYACVCLYWMIFYFAKNSFSVKQSKWMKVVAYLLTMGVFMSLSKQAYIGLFFMLLSLYPISTIVNIKKALPLLVIFILIIIYVPEYVDNILSLSDEKLAEEGGGSTIALREQQYDIAWKMFNSSRFIGNGIGSIDVMKSSDVFSGILGAESAWLNILPERGLFGAFSYLYLYIYLWKFKKYINQKVLLFFLLSIFIIENTGGIKDISIWGVVLLIVYRYNEIKNASISISS